jgi:phosphoribosylformylglycinamidine synthase
MLIADPTPIRRIYVEKKAGFDIEARNLQAELAAFLGGHYPELTRLRKLRILQRYDTACLDEAVFRRAAGLVFSEPQCDCTFYGQPVPAEPGDYYFGIEYIPGQYNQRSDSAAQCVELAVGRKPLVGTARIFVLTPGEGGLSGAALDAVKRYLINPVDSRETALDLPLSLEAAGSEGAGVPVLDGFSRAGREALEGLAARYGLAMSPPDLIFCRDYFAGEGRDPTLAELRILDTYWSDHCRHTTFTTVLEDIRIEDAPLAPALWKALAQYEAVRQEVYGAEERSRTLMDLATIGTRVLKKRGLLPDLDESPEINACSVKVNAEFADGSAEPWLLLFKNETHNHPTEIEPFGGAATCLGGAIRDPLSGRAYVHQAMRVSGGADPRAGLDRTLPGKLPQLKIAREAAAGYASYGNQIGLATGQVSEFYHPGFLAKRMELGAVMGAVPLSWLRREEPAAGDLVLLVGGKTGRDGIGGATGSSKVHTGESVETAGAEVQKGNAVEERKLQRLFRNPRVTALIKRCNDFGAGGVAVAVGELAPGLHISLDRMPKKYAGLDGIELAISESQERMAVVTAAADAAALIRCAAAENLDAVVIAEVTSSEENTARLRMTWRGAVIADLSRSFLNSNGAPRSAAALISASDAAALSLEREAEVSPQAILDRLERELASLRSGSRRGLQERFDGSIGVASVLFPWGGAEQGTPECGMASLLPSLDKDSRTASLMSFGYDPELAAWSPYLGAKGAIQEALVKFACLGGDPRSARLSLQEYFQRMDCERAWGKPVAALLGALEAELALGIPAIGGKDSMSGSYRDAANNIDLVVPPTLAAFAAGTAPAQAIRSGALCGEAGNLLVLFYNNDDAGDSEWAVFRANLDALASLTAQGTVKAAYPARPGGAAVALALMAFGNMTGVEIEAASPASVKAGAHQRAFLAEISAGADLEAVPGEAKWMVLGRTLGTGDPVFRVTAPETALPAEIPLERLRRTYESPLAQVYPQTSTGATVAEPVSGAVFPPKRYQGVPSNVKVRSRYPASLPLAVLPVFPGTNCEWDMERAFRKAGARTRLIIFRNRNREDILESTKELAAAIAEAQIVALSGGFSAGDEPDGSGKFIANVFRTPVITDAVTAFLEKRDGLILGICNGFQALIKLGLVPYGVCREACDTMPTLSFNRIGRHVSRMVRTRVMSTNSPWLSLEVPGAIHVVPVSHGEGRLVIGETEGRALFQNGQAAFCYVNAQGEPTMAEPDNPNGSDFAIEGLTSPDGRILGKMAHSERCGEYVHINVPGNKFQRIFEAGVRYFA